MTTSKTRAPIMVQYQPRAAWLWRQWKGTALVITWLPAFLQMTIGALLCLGIRSTAHATWPVGTVPPASNIIVSRLSCLSAMWNYQLTLTTFVVTFFLNQVPGYLKSSHALPCYHSAAAVPAVML